MRRYDIDWIRVIAIGLLIIYHAAIAFQPWGAMIAFPTNKESWPGLWFPMAILNVWRIPLLFFVSGMGVYFAMRSRRPKELILERGRRIFIPYVFGIFVIVPIQVAIWRMQWIYVYDPAHLWFLGNIFVYVLIFALPFYYIKMKSLSAPIVILLFIAALVAETLIVKPFPYEMYASTWHGFFLGMIAYLFGYVFASSDMQLGKLTWVALAVAAGLAAFRLSQHSYVWLTPMESACWILSVIGLGQRYLNKKSAVLAYLSQAAYPVYIVHMIFQFLVSAFIFPLSMPVQLKFVLLVILTLAGCLVVFEIIKKMTLTRFLFGLKNVRSSMSEVR